MTEKEIDIIEAYTRLEYYKEKSEDRKERLLVINNAIQKSKEKYNVKN